MNITELLASNKGLTMKEVASMLEVSAGTVTAMKKKQTKMQDLAVAQLHKQLERTVDIYTTEHTDSYGNTYFSGYFYFEDVKYNLDYQYGYGSHCEDVALRMLLDAGKLKGIKLDNGMISTYKLSKELNVKVKTVKTTVRRKKDMF